MWPDRFSFLTMTRRNIGMIYKTEAEAQQITLAIHNTGSGIAGVFNYEVAEQKVYETVNISRSAGFPLSLKVEEE